MSRVKGAKKKARSSFFFTVMRDRWPEENSNKSRKRGVSEKKQQLGNKGPSI